MASLLSIARPYALAAFEYAQKKQHLAAWKAMLKTASFIALEPPMVKLLSNSAAISTDQLVQLFCELLGTLLDAEQKNFIKLLGANKRFSALPQIFQAFNSYCAKFEKINTVRMVTAIPMKEDYQQTLISVLEKRLQSQVTLSAEVDPSIIAGAIIYIGDRVIDGSVRGQLTRLLEFSLR